MDDLSSYLYGGPDYAKVLAWYGQASADKIAAAAATGDRVQLNAAFADARTARGDTKPAQDASTLDAFGNQIITNPLGAPLSGLNNILGNTFFSFLKSPWVLFFVGLGLFFFVFNGAEFLKRRFK